MDNKLANFPLYSQTKREQHINESLSSEILPRSKSVQAKRVEYFFYKAMLL